RNVERIARRFLALMGRKEPVLAKPIPLIQAEPTLYDVLLTHRGASDDELRRAYKRQRELYRENSIPITSLVKDEDLPRENALVDEAHDTLLDPLRRRAYDATVFPDDEEDPAPKDPNRD